MFNILKILIYLWTVLFSITNANLTSFGLRSDEEILDDLNNSGNYVRKGDYYIKRRRPNQRSDWEINPNWPNNTIPFIISEKLPQELVPEIIGAVKYLNNYTCLNFRPVDLETDQFWIRFLKQTPEEHIRDPVEFCGAGVGFFGVQDQPVIVGMKNLCNAPIFVHELLHIVGLYHEHQRSDRDKYITVNWKNVKETYKTQFLTHIEECLMYFPEDQCKFNNYGVPYNYESIVHYCVTCGSISLSDKVITAVNGTTDAIGDPAKIGQLYGLSEGDWLLVNRKYGCDPDKNPQIKKPPPIPDNPLIPLDRYNANYNESSIQPDYTGFVKTEGNSSAGGGGNQTSQNNKFELFYLNK